MATKKKKTGPKAPTVRAHPDIQEIFALIVEASRKRDETLRQVEAFEAVDKKKEARTLLDHAQHIQERIEALQAEVRPKTPHR